MGISFGEVNLGSSDLLTNDVHVRSGTYDPPSTTSTKELRFPDADDAVRRVLPEHRGGSLVLVTRSGGTPRTVDGTEAGATPDPLRPDDLTYRARNTDIT
jgi:hypothetical protein